MSTLLAILTVAFGTPQAIMTARVLAAMVALCPCGGDATCNVIHVRAARAIAVVALEQRDPDEAAALLLGAAAHETGARVEHQARGGPAVTVWQLEVPPRERAALLADPVAAARLALSRARACRGTWRGYYPGRCDATGSDVDRVTGELARAAMSARFMLAAQ